MYCVLNKIIIIYVYDNAVSVSQATLHVFICLSLTQCSATCALLEIYLNTPAPSTQTDMSRVILYHEHPPRYIDMTGELLNFTV